LFPWITQRLDSSDYTFHQNLVFQTISFELIIQTYFTQTYIIGTKFIWTQFVWTYSIQTYFFRTYFFGLKFLPLKKRESRGFSFFSLRDERSLIKKSSLSRSEKIGKSDQCWLAEHFLYLLKRKYIWVQAALVIRGLFICEFAYSHCKYGSKWPFFPSKMDYLSANSRFAVPNDGTYLPRITCT
jgi:hypothetical protein